MELCKKIMPFLMNWYWLTFQPQMSSCNDKVHKLIMFFSECRSWFCTEAKQGLLKMLANRYAERHWWGILQSGWLAWTNMIYKYLISNYWNGSFKNFRVYSTKRQFCLFALQLVKVKCPRICGHFGGRCFEKVSPMIFLIM